MRSIESMSSGRKIVRVLRKKIRLSPASPKNLSEQSYFGKKNRINASVALVNSSVKLFLNMGSSLSKGLKKEVLVRGDPKRRVKKGDIVTVECVGSIQGGEQFWSTKDPGQLALTFPCGIGKVGFVRCYLIGFSGSFGTMFTFSFMFAYSIKDEKNTTRKSSFGSLFWSSRSHRPGWLGLWLVWASGMAC